jgi:hypothetical protein
MNAHAELDPEAITDTTYREESVTKSRPVWRRWIIPAILLYAVVAYGLGVYWSIQTAPFDPRAVALERVGGDESKLVPGVVAVATMAEVAGTLLDKPGGFTHNDRFPPGILLDNMPNWEYGALKEVRDSVRSLRNDFSRSQTQSVENVDLREADSFLNYDMDSWILPATEQEFRRGIGALDRYGAALADGSDRSARFFSRADNLAAYLAVVEKRLGSYTQRLSASVGDDELAAALIANNNIETPPEGAPEIRVKTPWLEVDDVFYEARGYSWALLHMFKALAIEFEPVLRDKNAKVSVQQVIRDLEDATVRMWSPVVLNGHGFGLVSNHSLILASYLARANAAVLDLRILLQQG